MGKKNKKMKFSILIFVSLLLLILSIPSIHSSSDDTWFNSSWNYRIPITITENKHSGNLTNYTVEISLNTTDLYSAGKLNSSCKDIRFADASGNEIDYWFWRGECVNDGSANSTFWVEVPTIENATTTTIYMYYGNPSVESTRNINKTMIIGADFDTFSSGNVYGQQGWDWFYSSGNDAEAATIESFAGYNTAKVQSGYRSTTIYKNISGTDFTGGFEIIKKEYTFGASESHGLMNTTDEYSNDYGDPQTFLGFGIDGWGGSHYTKVRNSTLYTIEDLNVIVYDETPNVNRTYRHTVADIGSNNVNISTYVDGVLKTNFTVYQPNLQHHDAIYASHYSGGATESYNIYYMFARKYVQPEPTYTTGSEETTTGAFIQTITSPTNTTYSSNTINVNLTTNIISNSTYSLDGAANVSISNETTNHNTTISGVSSGSHNIYICSTNSSDVVCDKIYFTVDLFPSVSIEKPNDLASLEPSIIEFNYTPVDDIGFQKAELYMNNSNNVLDSIEKDIEKNVESNVGCWGGNAIYYPGTGDEVWNYIQYGNDSPPYYYDLYVLKYNMTNHSKISLTASMGNIENFLPDAGAEPDKIGDNYYIVTDDKNQTTGKFKLVMRNSTDGVTFSDAIDITSESADFVGGYIYAVDNETGWIFSGFYNGSTWRLEKYTFNKTENTVTFNNVLTTENIRIATIMLKKIDDVYYLYYATKGNGALKVMHSLDGVTYSSPVSLISGEGSGNAYMMSYEKIGNYHYLFVTTGTDSNGLKAWRSTTPNGTFSEYMTMYPTSANLRAPRLIQYNNRLILAYSNYTDQYFAFSEWNLTFNKSWSVNSTNTSSIVNNSINTISVDMPAGHYLWNIKITDSSGQASWGTSNRTLIVASGDSTPPSITFVSQYPADISSTNMFTSDLNVSYNMTDTSGINESSVKFYYKINSSTNDILQFINGTSVLGWQIKEGTNVSSLWNFSLDHMNIYPATYNIDESVMETEQKHHYTLDAKNKIIKTRFLNVSKISEYNYFIIDAQNQTGTTEFMRIYYCNETYTAGNPKTSENCVEIFDLMPASPYNFSEGGSKYWIVPMAINTTSGMIGDVYVTNTSYILLRDSASPGGWNISYITNISRTDTVQVSGNNGIAYTNFSGTIDGHIHQFDGNSLWYYACANDTYENNGCSAVRQDLLELGNLPPNSPDVYSPTEGTYSGNITINYTESLSPNGYPITHYNISLVNLTLDFVQEIQGNNSVNLSYVWDSTSATDGEYFIRVESCDNQSQCSYGYSENFSIDSNPTYPSFSGYARNPTTPNDDQDVEINVTVNETSLDTVILEVNITGTLTNYTVTTNSSNEFYHTLSRSTYVSGDNVTYSWWANDTSGNSNVSVTFSFIVATPEKNTTSGSGGDNPPPDDSPDCVPNWKCGEWSLCVAGISTRTCTDMAECNTTDYSTMPNTTIECIDYIPIYNGTVGDYFPTRLLVTSYMVFSGNMGGFIENIIQSFTDYYWRPANDWGLLNFFFTHAFISILAFMGLVWITKRKKWSKWTYLIWVIAVTLLSLILPSF